MQRKFIFISSFALLALNSLAHDQIVHEAITVNAAASALNNSPAFAGFINVVSPDIELKVATNSMRIGSFDEDFAANEDKTGGGNRSYNHFYDPLDNTYGKGLTDVPNDRRSSTPVGTNSFAWASISNCVGVNYYGEFYTYAYQHNLNTSNIWSWPNARYYEWLGLTATNQSDRQANLDNMFRAVGQVMHLLEDTSQPQHVRNEQHVFPFSDPNANPNANWWVRHLDPWISPIEEYGSKYVNQLKYGDGSMLDWRGAGFTKLEDFWDRHMYNGNAAIYNC